MKDWDYGLALRKIILLFDESTPSLGDNQFMDEKCFRRRNSNLVISKINHKGFLKQYIQKRKCGERGT